jgi:hypothetical protein
MKDAIWTERLNKIITLPQRHQRDAIRVLSRNFKQIINENWNTLFGPESLYEAWSNILPMRNLYEVNRNVISKIISEKQNFTILEIGGGTGALWKNFFTSKHNGNYILIDPVEDSHIAVSKVIPENIPFFSLKKGIQQIETLPNADIIICSLMLHHIPGIEYHENIKYGIESLGKGDILKKMLQSIKENDGIIILNESDVYTDIKLPPKSHLLYHRLIDSYVRRAAKSIAFMMETEDIQDELYLKLEQIILSWSLDQIEIVGNADLDKRDVYELDTIHWQELFDKIGAEIVNHKVTDEWHLFHQYILKNK